MANWKSSIPSKYLKASDFPQPALLTMHSFTEEKIGDDTKPCLWFTEVEKGMILNIVNGGTIEKACGSPNTEDWIGKKIVLFSTQTDFKGERVDCIRCRAPKPQAGVTPAPSLPKVPEPFMDDGTLPF